VFVRFLSGRVFEGNASARGTDPASGDPRFAFDHLDVPMRIRFDAMPDASPTDSSLGFERFAMMGTVENATAPVTASDGTCMAALSSLGDTNPLYQRGTGRLRVMRFPGMHAPFDDVFTLDWNLDAMGENMGAGLYVGPADLIGTSVPMPTDATNSPHGTPWGGPSADLHAVASTGGSPCTP
jgi:hypothetical protein